MSLIIWGYHCKMQNRPSFLCSLTLNIAGKIIYDMLKMQQEIFVIV